MFSFLRHFFAVLAALFLRFSPKKTGTAFIVKFFIFFCYQNFAWCFRFCAFLANVPCFRREKRPADQARFFPLPHCIFPSVVLSSSCKWGKPFPFYALLQNLMTN